jgi:cell wall assembly regulator SMI1
MRLALRPGLVPTALDELRCRLNDALPTELAQLLAWHDGQNPDFEGTFADGWCLLRGEDIPLLKADLDSDPPPGWQSGWIPWARTANDSFLVIAPTPPDLPIRAVWVGKSAPPIVAPSLTAWFATFLADLEAGNYAEDAERGTFLNTHTGCNTAG